MNKKKQRTKGPSGLPFRTLTRECLFSLKQRNAEPKEQRREQKH